MHMSHHHSDVPLPAPLHVPSGNASLLEALWRRRLTLAFTLALCLFVASVYLLCATRIFVAGAKVLLEQNAPAALNDNHNAFVPSETYVQTQADVFLSGPVVSRALDAIDYRALKTFGPAGPDPVDWVRRSGKLKVDVARKSDVVVVSMESPSAEEAALIANAIVKAYIVEQSLRQRSMGGDMAAALRHERGQLSLKRDEALALMQNFRRENDTLSFATDRANIAVERTATLSAAQTTAEMTAMELRAQWEATRKALSNPESLSAFVESQQFRAKDAGDHEYDDLRAQLIQQMLALSTASAMQGPRNSRVQSLEWVVNSLRTRIVEKERAIASAHLVSLSTQLSTAEDNERQLRAAMHAERTHLLALGPQAAEYAKLEAEVSRIQKQCDLLDARLAEVTVNELEAEPMNVQFLEPAHAETKPIKPNKAMVLGAALMVGWILGIGLALGREWRDARLRSPQEIVRFLGTPVLAAVPPINARLSPVARGQILYLDPHSPSAEAYRSIRTSLHLGPCRDARTLLLASPTSGDGKSTTASNLAIAFAQAGCRTLLVDCDMREPVQHLIFETDGSVGISSVVAGEKKLKEALRPTRVPSLYLLPCGPIPASPSELLAGPRFAQLMRSLLGSFDRIVIDSPPLMTVADARILAASADATIMVLRMNQSIRNYSVTSLDSLQKVGANVVGSIANDMIAVRESHYYRGSWQYASSAKRVMASVAGRLSVEQTVVTVGPVGVDLLPTGEAFAVDEPDWSADVRPNKGVERQASAAQNADASPGAGNAHAW
ncbi:MAG TPA: polysaccharide biosynthesis tyrosine autokinase [Tepidisphaeraceae bacterium]|nr:polysaccharide biosynthesis tyrosine autokinase [Tepidisphaeraceae bacterium]